MLFQSNCMTLLETEKAVFCVLFHYNVLLKQLSRTEDSICGSCPPLASLQNLFVAQRGKCEPQTGKSDPGKVIQLLSFRLLQFLSDIYNIDGVKFEINFLDRLCLFYLD